MSSDFTYAPMPEGTPADANFIPAGPVAGNTTAPQGIAAASTPTPSVQRICTQDHAAHIQLTDHLDDDNWGTWRADIMLTFSLCEIEEYIFGQITCPNKDVDEISAKNWKMNNSFGMRIIRTNLSCTQKIHVADASTSHDMWSNLEAIHQSRGMQTQHQLMQDLYKMKAHDGQNIIEHLRRLKEIWGRITLICKENMPMNSDQFKAYIIHSLPSTWVPFTTPYLKEATYAHTSVNALIGDLNEEYRRRVRDYQNEVAGSNNAYVASTSKTTTSVLPARLGLKAAALAWLEAALAFRNPRPGQSRRSGLGPGLARPGPRLF